MSLASSERHAPFRDVEIAIRDRAGATLLFRLNGLPVYCPDSGSFLGYRGTAENVTALRQREEALIGAKESAELANRAKTRSEEHTSELQSLMRISYAVFGLKKKKKITHKRYKK